MGEAGLFQLVLILEPLSVNGHGVGENVQKNGSLGRNVEISWELTLAKSVAPWKVIVQGFGAQHARNKVISLRLGAPK
jgi:hypothetical protein